LEGGVIIFAVVKSANTEYILDWTCAKEIVNKYKNVCNQSLVDFLEKKEFYLDDDIIL
jgi:hypothetical protein